MNITHEYHTKLYVRGIPMLWVLQKYQQVNNEEIQQRSLDKFSFCIYFHFICSKIKDGHSLHGVHCTCTFACTLVHSYPLTEQLALGVSIELKQTYLATTQCCYLLQLSVQSTRRPIPPLPSGLCLPSVWHIIVYS